MAVKGNGIQATVRHFNMKLHRFSGQPIGNIRPLFHTVKEGVVPDATAQKKNLGIPIIDGCGPLGGFPHSEDEFLDIETVQQRFDLFCAIIRDIGGRK